MAVAPEVGRGLRLAALLLLGCSALPAANYFVTLAGLGGGPDYETQFVKWAQALDKQLKTMPDSQTITLTGTAATREQVLDAIAKTAARTTADDSFALFLIGHGTFDGTDYKINLPGPDLTAGELAKALERVAARRQLVVNMTSCSGASVALLAKKDRVVIAATKSGTEKNAPIFPRYWVDAFSDPAADTDKNGAVSALEAFRYAERKTAAYFEEEKLLATEHAIMTDKGSAAAVREPKAENRQGLLAGAFLLKRESTEGGKAVSPQKQRLVAAKEDLEAKIDRLKYEKAALPEEEYKRQLAALLLQLARTQAEIDK